MDVYVKDNITWAASGFASYIGNFYPVRGIAVGDSKCEWAAIIDTAGNYIIPPQKTKNNFKVINVEDSLVLVENPEDSLQSIIDYHLHTLLHFQKYPVAGAFYYKNSFYSILRYDTIYQIPIGNFDGTPIFLNHHNKYAVLNNDSLVKSIAQYNLRWFTDNNGYWVASLSDGRDIPPEDADFNSPFKGYFMAEDNTGKRGIVSIDGKVQLPDLSFRHLIFQPKGPNVFLVDKGYIVNSKNKALLDGVCVNNVYQVSKPGNTPLYLVIPGYFYMNDDGKGYYNKWAKQAKRTD